MQEGRKVEDLLQRLEGMNLQEIGRDQLHDLEVKAVSLRRDLYDVVNLRAPYATQR